MKTIVQLKKEFDKLKNDVEKWKWVRENQDTGIIVMLDNDDTYGVIEWDTKEEISIFQFENYIGWHDGVCSLLESIGIKAEGV